MKKSALKELLIFILWGLTEAAGFLIFSKYFKIYALIAVLLFESFIFFQLPYSEYFRNADYFDENPNHGKIRAAVMFGAVAFLIFVLKWNYFLALYFIITIRIDGIIRFFGVSKEERQKILKNEGLAELKSYLYMITAAVLMLVIFFGIGMLYLSKYFAH